MNIDKLREALDREGIDPGGLLATSGGWLDSIK
jgi:hypothetical protein